jgi:hypothetical protein
MESLMASTGGTQRPSSCRTYPPVDIVITMGCNVQCRTSPASTAKTGVSTIPPAKGERFFKGDPEHKE